MCQYYDVQSGKLEENVKKLEGLWDEIN